MGKAKKNVSKNQNHDNGDDDSQEEIEVEAKPVKAVKGKGKPVKNASVESEDEDLDSDEIQSKKDAKQVKTKKSAKASKSKTVDSDEEEMEVETIKPTSAFALLAVDSGDDNNDSPDEEVVKSKSKKGKKEKAKLEEKEMPEKVEESTGKKAKRKGKKKDEEEDIEKMLAELELEYSGKKVEKAPEDTKKEPEGKKKGRKGKTQEEVREVEEATPEPEPTVEEAPVENVESGDKKKKKKKKKKGEEKDDIEEEAAETAVAAETAEAAEGVDTGEAKEDSEEQTGDKKKKKKKKKAKEGEEAPAPEAEAAEGEDQKKKKAKKKGEETKKEKKGPGSKVLAAMKEQLLKIKEEEERLKREQEEAEKRAAEEERLRKEQLRIEQEKREAKKQRERERKERLKAEGKLLTDKQRQALARSKKSLEALRAQGIDIPAAGEKRGPRPGTRIRPSKQKDAQAQRAADGEDRSPEAKADEKKEEQKESEEPTAPQEEEEEVKESWDADTSSEEEEEEKSSSAPPAPAPGASAAVPTPAPAAAAAATTPSAEEETSSEESEESDTEEDSDEEETESSEDDEERSKRDAASKRQKALERIQKRREEAEKKRNLENLRAPVVCVLGHVDTGKTKILDKLRRTNVQDGEAGGITQQIGATNVPIEAIREASKMVTSFQDLNLKIPGLLIIDTPGHESFSNLRSRGSSLCDIAILVVDIMHGLEPQTIESINLLKQRKTPFVVALNKIDRLYDWVTNPRKDVRDLIKMQQRNTQQEFQDRTKSVVLQFAEQSLNAALFYDNPDPRTYISMVPTSAATGDGMGNLMALIVELTQTVLSKRLMYSDELHATVLEVKAIPGYGTTIDVILVNGTLREGETIVLAGTEGPIVTQIRSLLLPQPMKELRVKNTYTENKVVKAAQGVKITAKDLEKAIAGLNMLVAHQPDEVDICRDEVAGELKSALGRIKVQERGVYVQASTLGSLEALLEFLKTSEIPYSNIRIGPVVKKDVMKASIMLEHDPQYAVILAFDVKIERDAQEMADSIGVRIFQADIIYHLFDRFIQYRDELKQKKRDEFKNIAVFPCKLRILPQFIFNTRDPIVVGVMVENGIVKEGTPLCVPSKEFVEIGIVSTIEANHKPVESARKGQEVCIKILPIPGQAPRLLGRHFEIKDMLVSKISRESIDACKNYFRDDLQKSDWQLMVELKKLFQIL